MSTVTLSKPHCAITSAENPDGIASQAFTTALPEAQTFLTLFAIDRVPLIVDRSKFRGLADGPLNADFADADFARGVDDRGPGIVRQGHTVFGAVRAHLPFGIARDQHGVDAGHRPGRADEVGIARDFAIKVISG